MVMVRWFGHSCFKITAASGTSIVTDPFEEADVGYPTPRVKADIVMVSHDHYDHNKVDVLVGRPEVVRGPDNHTVLGMYFYGIRSYHDDDKGSKRGSNVVFTFNVDGLQICHMGDLGHSLSDEQMMDIGAVDILMIPVGGYFTIDAQQASEIVSQLNPLITIPMHYKTPLIDFLISPVDAFLEGKDNVVHHDSNTLVVDRDSMPKSPYIVVLKYE